MELVKLIFTTHDQQGRWLQELNAILKYAIEAKMIFDDSYGRGTLVIYALLDKE